jgi:hypothetical protein
MNALQALSLNVPVQDSVMNHTKLASLDGETQPEWEPIISPCAYTPTTAELITFLESRCSLGVIADYPITKVSHCPFTALSINWTQGQ